MVTEKKEFEEFSLRNHSGLLGKTTGSKHRFHRACAVGRLLELVQLLGLLELLFLVLAEKAGT